MPHLFAGYCHGCQYEIEEPRAHEIGKHLYCSACALEMHAETLSRLLDPYWSPTVAAAQQARAALPIASALLQSVADVLDQLRPSAEDKDDAAGDRAMEWQRAVAP